jgi:hypothetical protein
VEGTRKIALSALVSPASELKTLFSTKPGSIRRKLENPEMLRPNGWDLQTGDAAQTVGGEMARVANGDRKVLELYRDGTLILIVRADDWFLAWATPKDLQRINPLALAEVAYSFVSFYEDVIADLTTPPAKVHFRIDLRNMCDREPYASLVPHQLGSIAQMFGDGARIAPQNDATLREVTSAANYNAASVAYQLVREIYIWFGLNEEQIPYVTFVNGLGAIDVSAIAGTR